MFPAAFAQERQMATEDLDVDANDSNDGTAGRIVGTNTSNSRRHGSEDDDSDSTIISHKLGAALSHAIQSGIQMPATQSHDVRVKSESDQDDEPEIEYRIIDDDSMTSEAGSSRHESRKRKNDQSAEVAQPQIAKRKARSSSGCGQPNDEATANDGECDTETPSTSTQNQAARNSATNFDTMLDEFAKIMVEIGEHDEKLKTWQVKKAAIRTKLKTYASTDSNYDILLEIFAKISIKIDECDKRLKVLKTQKDTMKTKFKEHSQK